jgi:hypothetical protein
MFAVVLIAIERLTLAEKLRARRERKKVINLSVEPAHSWSR